MDGAALYSGWTGSPENAGPDIDGPDNDKLNSVAVLVDDLYNQNPSYVSILEVFNVTRYIILLDLLTYLRSVA